MPEKKDSTQTRGHIMSADEVVRNASINILLICEAMGKIDPNENYTLWLGFVEQFVAVAEVLKTLWDQRRGSLMLMPIQLPESVHTIKMDATVWNKSEVLGDIIKAAHNLRNGFSSDSVSDDFPF